MSERDGEMNTGQLGCIFAIVALLIIVVIITVNKKDVSEIRDLQRRVGALEEQRR